MVLGNISGFGNVNLADAYDSSVTTSKVYGVQSFEFIERVACACALLVFAVAAVVTNVFAVACLVTFVKNQFTLLRMSLFSSQLSCVMITVIWEVPVMIAQTNLSKLTLGQSAGLIELFFWHAFLYTHIVLTFDRFFAVSFCERYRKFFAASATKFLVVLFPYVAGLLHIVPHIVTDCLYTFRPAFIVWSFSSQQNCSAIKNIIWTVSGRLTFSLVFSLYFAAFFKIRRSRRLVLQLKLKVDPSRREEHERKYFMEAVPCSMVLELLLASIYILAPCSANRWWIFLTASPMKPVCFCVTASLLLIQNRQQFKQVLRRMFRLKDTDPASAPQFDTGHRRSTWAIARNIIQGTIETEQLEQMPGKRKVQFEPEARFTTYSAAFSMAITRGNTPKTSTIFGRKPRTLPQRLAAKSKKEKSKNLCILPHSVKPNGTPATKDSSKEEREQSLVIFGSVV